MEKNIVERRVTIPVTDNLHGIAETEPAGKIGVYFIGRETGKGRLNVSDKKRYSEDQ
jgi:hypothetical protein